MAFDESIIDKIPPKELLPQTEDGLPAIDGRVSVTADPEGMLANMVLYAPQNGGRPITTEKVLEELKNNGITTGIDEFDINDMIEAQVYETPVCVARAIPPKRGQNGSIVYKFDKDHKLTPQRDEFGICNYRELNSIVPIRKGEIIAVITLPTEGTPGENIYGKPIPAEAGIPAKYTVGRNTMLTADEKMIVAACDGHILFSKGGFIVEDTVTVKTDLDISIGNINFFGDVHIKGNVMEGFTVNAGRNVRIDGSVFGSEIVAGGKVTIVGGCIGSTVRCEGSADIGFCENATIRAEGNVVSKQFAFCDVFCYGALTAKGTNGVIVGGKITSMHDINAGIIGSDKYTPTEINIGDGSVLFNKKCEAEALLKDVKKSLDNAVRNLDFLKFRKKQQAGILTDAQQKQVKVETRAKLLNSMRRKELEDEIRQLDEDIKGKDNLCARVTGIIYPGAKFCVNFLTLEITEKTKRSRVTIVDDKLTTVSM